MSCWYEMYMEVGGVLSEEEAEIVEEVMQDWWSFDNDMWNLDAEGNMTSPHAQDTLRDYPHVYRNKVCVAIWKKLDRYVPIKLHMTYLEDLPCNTHEGTEATYQKLIKEGASVDSIC